MSSRHKHVSPLRHRHFAVASRGVELPLVRGARVVCAWCARASFARVSGAPSPSGSVDTLPLRPFRTPPGSLRKFVTQFVTQVRYASSFRKFVTQVRYASSLRKFVTPVRYAGSCTVCLAVMSSYAPYCRFDCTTIHTPCV